MLLNRVVLKNFKQFAGTQEIDLSVPSDGLKNIVLIGGLNGSGKTTLLEAIRLALYGKHHNDDLWKARKYTSYDEYIAECINRSYSNRGGQEFSISLQFEKDSGSELTVNRSWILDRGRWVDSISVDDDDELADGDEQVDQEDWNDYVRSIVPPGVARFFFFDGEMIQDMASDDDHEEKLIQSIRDILDINLYTRLAGDLTGLYEPFLQEQVEGDASQLDAAKQQLSANQQQMDIKQAALLDLKLQRDKLSGQIDELERRVTAASHADAQRLLLENQLRSLHEDRKGVVSRLSEIMANEFVWVATTKLLTSLKDQLVAEKKYLEAEESSATISLRRDEFISAVFDDLRVSPGSLMNAHREQLKAKCRDVWNRLFSVPEKPKTQIHTDLSTAVMGDLIQTIDTVTTAARQSVKAVLRELADVERRAISLAEQIQLVPESKNDPKGKEELDQLHERKGVVKSKCDDLENEIAQLRTEQAPLARKVKSLEKKMPLIKIAQQKIALSSKVRAVLQEVDREMSAERAEDVQAYITEMFRRLSNKDELVHEFQIHRGTFSVSMVTAGGKPMPKRQLSAGEKEVYALSLLWALGRSSDRRLPIVIDTPLGRLDSRHRAQIADNYFPSAGEQVVILSTDTEVNQEIFNHLKPHVAKAYTLEFNERNRCTQVRKGYFGR